MKTSVSSKGQIILPAEIRHRDGIKAGQVFKIKRLKSGDYRLIRQKRRSNEGLVDWLLKCPAKGSSCHLIAQKQSICDRDFRKAGLVVVNPFEDKG